MQDLKEGDEMKTNEELSKMDKFYTISMPALIIIFIILFILIVGVVYRHVDILAEYMHGGTLFDAMDGTPLDSSCNELFDCFNTTITDLFNVSGQAQIQFTVTELRNHAYNFYNVSGEIILEICKCR